MIKRISTLIVVIGLGYLTPFWVFLPAAAVYIFFWNGYELLVLATLIDIQFGVGGMLYGLFYTTTVGALLVGMSVIRPHMRFSE